MWFAFQCWIPTVLLWKKSVNAFLDTPIIVGASLTPTLYNGAWCLRALVNWQTQRKDLDIAWNELDAVYREVNGLGRGINGNNCLRNGCSCYS